MQRQCEGKRKRWSQDTKSFLAVTPSRMHASLLAANGRDARGIIFKILGTHPVQNTEQSKGDTVNSAEAESGPEETGSVAGQEVNGVGVV